MCVPALLSRRWALRSLLPSWQLFSLRLFQKTRQSSTTHLEHWSQEYNFSCTRHYQTKWLNLHQSFDVIGILHRVDCCCRINSFCFITKTKGLSLAYSFSSSEGLLSNGCTQCHRHPLLNVMDSQSVHANSSYVWHWNTQHKAPLESERPRLRERKVSAASDPILPSSSSWHSLCSLKTHTWKADVGERTRRRQSCCSAWSRAGANGSGCCSPPGAARGPEW